MSRLYYTGYLQWDMLCHARITMDISCDFFSNVFESGPRVLEINKNIYDAKCDNNFTTYELILALDIESSKHSMFLCSTRGTLLNLNIFIWLILLIRGYHRVSVLKFKLTRMLSANAD